VIESQKEQITGKAMENGGRVGERIKENCNKE
jgi:hypothetical protein